MTATEPRQSAPEGDAEPLSPTAELELAAHRAGGVDREPKPPFPDEGWGSASWTGPTRIAREVMRGTQARYSEDLTSDWVLRDGKARPRWGAEDAPTHVNPQGEPAYTPGPSEKTGQIERLFASVLTSKGSIDLRDPRLPEGRCALHLFGTGERVPAHRDSGRICKACADWCSRNKFTHLNRVSFLRSKAAKSALYGKQIPKWADLHKDPEQEAQTPDPDWSGPSWFLKVRKSRLDWYAVQKRRTERTKKVRNRYTKGSTSQIVALTPEELAKVEAALDQRVRDEALEIKRRRYQTVQRIVMTVNVVAALLEELDTYELEGAA